MVLHNTNSYQFYSNTDNKQLSICLILTRLSLYYRVLGIITPLYCTDKAVNTIFVSPVYSRRHMYSVPSTYM